MPELPEVEVIRRFLEKKLINKTIIGLKVLSPKSFIGNPELVEGQKIIKFTRIGKQLSIHLSNNLILLIHLKMTGQLVLNAPTKHTRLIFTLSDNSHLYFNDLRKFGWIKLIDSSQISQHQQNLGIDILDKKFTPQYIFSQLQKSTRAVKLVLLDQTKFAGIGNIYANDALFLSKINPQTPANKITLKQSQKLQQSLIKIMTESITHGGSTAKDKGYIKPDSTTGQHQLHFQVYQREGKPCLVCQTKIKRIKTSGRSTFFCPNCQK